MKFDARGAGPFVVLVVSEPGMSAARSSLMGTLKDVSVTEVKKRPLKFVPIDFKEESQLQAESDKNKSCSSCPAPHRQP